MTLLTIEGEMSRLFSSTAINYGSTAEDRREIREAAEERYLETRKHELTKAVLSGDNSVISRDAIFERLSGCDAFWDDLADAYINYFTNPDRDALIQSPHSRKFLVSLFLVMGNIEGAISQISEDVAKTEANEYREAS
jgi:hypothetical protein